MSLAKQQLETMGPVTPLQIVQEKVASMKALVRLDLASAVTVRTHTTLKILLSIFQSAFFPPLSWISMWENHFGEWNIFCQPSHAPAYMQLVDQPCQRWDLPGPFLTSPCLFAGKNACHFVLKISTLFLGESWIRSIWHASTWCWGALLYGFFPSYWRKSCATIMWIKYQTA